MNLLDQRDQLIGIVTLVGYLSLLVKHCRLVSLLAVSTNNSWSLSARRDIVFVESATVNTNARVVLVDESWLVRSAEVVFVLVVEGRPSCSLRHLPLNDVLELRVDGLGMIGSVFGIGHL